MKYRTARAAGLGLVAALMLSAAEADAQQSPPSQSPPVLEPKAMQVLHAACDTLGKAATISFTAVDTYERAARNGQPLYYTNKSRVTLQRPDKLRVIKLADGVPDEFYYDGKAMMAYIPSANLVAVADAPPTVDQMLDAAWDVAGIYFPFSDMLVSNPCAVFDKNLTSAFYVGQSQVVGGTTTDMVAIGGDGMRAEFWIGASDHLPRMVRVTYPNEPAQARYQTDYSDWQLGAQVDAAAFKSEKAAGAARIAFQPPPLSTPPETPAPAKKP